VPDRVREDLVEPSGGCPVQEGVDHVERLDLPDVAVVERPDKPAQDGKEFGGIGRFEANPVHANP